MSDFIIKESQGKGKGLFSTKDFGINEILFKFDGEKISAESAFKLPNNDRLLQVGSQLYLDLGTHYSVFINHLCSPNCMIKISVNMAFLLSTRQIKSGDEITFDYSLTSTETLDTWSMRCDCHRFYCRKIISGFSTIPAGQKMKLIADGMVPDYVINGI